MPNEDKALREAISRAGGKHALARALGISHPAIMQWRKAPVLRVLEIERLTGVSRHDLRPDVYPRD
jgi:DNA-binding transcriptional regulator YdaS (Cro superfamily)